MNFKESSNYLKVFTKKKNLKIREGSLTSILTPNTIEKNPEINLKNPPGRIELQQSQNQVPFAFSLQFSFGPVNEKILNFCYDKNLTEKFLFLTNPTSKKNIQNLLYKFYGKLGIKDTVFRKIAI